MSRLAKLTKDEFDQIMSDGDLSEKPVANTKVPDGVLTKNNDRSIVKTQYVFDKSKIDIGTCYRLKFYNKNQLNEKLGGCYYYDDSDMSDEWIIEAIIYDVSSEELYFTTYLPNGQECHFVVKLIEYITNEIVVERLT
jgi:hypothetical protein